MTVALWIAILTLLGSILTAVGKIWFGKTWEQQKSDDFDLAKAKQDAAIKEWVDSTRKPSA